MKKKELCKYNADELDLCSITGERCQIYGCNKYENKYARRLCVHYDPVGCGISKCKVLTDGYDVAPCEHPRIKKSGEPRQCTFYKMKEVSCDV